MSGGGGDRLPGRRSLDRPIPIPLRLPGASAASGSQSYPGPDDEAGLLRKLLNRRRQSSAGTLPQQQPLSSAQLRRNRDKLVALLEEGQYSLLDEAGSMGAPSPVPSPITTQGLPGDDELLPPQVEESPAYPIGRITIHCTADSYDIKGLRQHLEEGGYMCTQFPEALYSRYMRRSGQVTGEIFFFEFGVACFWDLSPTQELKILRQSLQQYEEGKLPTAKVESDTFAFRHVPYSKPSIQNDLITLPTNMVDAHLMKLSISFALAQSTKLSVLEERALTIAAATRKLPMQLAQEGKVAVKSRAVAKLMGRVFIEQAALNLLGSVLDTPDFFWEPGVGDNMQSVYDKVFDYLEMNDRIEILNSRLQVLHELLDMLRLQGQAQHSDFLEIIIILLICVDCLILLFTLAALLGWVGPGGSSIHNQLASTRWGASLSALLGTGS
ncbi:Sporulation RMD1 [Chlorella sorokiniana]|uniref:Sporulation RMD1 n=1 Tax=Chlorella sorokiniana TaxID=3076 RepID=A0A2P6TWH7_CHLSO|nr:Sporulation RMD1 [Chlorella sorokiniana]|eukprot:PRW58417.1 Sporulation RMD1 [Chlorella sorokiniana]